MNEAYMLLCASEMPYISPPALHSNYSEFHTRDLRQAKVAEALGLTAIRIA
jgi:hypothetical protein